MAKLGWCLDGHHAGGKYDWSKPCPGKVLLLECDCKCHSPKTTTTPRRRRRK